jgi:TonB family protein
LGARGRRRDLADRHDSPMKTTTRIFGLLLLAGTALAQAPEERAREANSARWVERVQRTDNVWQCGTPRTDCITLQLVVENKTDDELSCRGRIRFAQPNAHGIADSKGYAEYVAPRESKAISHALAPVDLEVASLETDCTPTRLIPADRMTAIQDIPCKHTVVQGVNFADYYPPDAKAENRAGKVLVEFSLPGSPSTPEDLKIARSSGFADLDAAALRAVRAMKFETTCTRVRTRFLVTFGLN